MEYEIYLTKINIAFLHFKNISECTINESIQRKKESDFIVQYFVHCR